MAKMKVVTRGEEEANERLMQLRDGAAKIIETTEKFERLLRESDSVVTEEEIGIIEDLGGKIGGFKDLISKTLHRIADAVKTETKEEKFLKSAIGSIDVCVRDEDLRNPNLLLDYVELSSVQKSIPKINSLSNAESIIKVAKQFKGSQVNNYRLALVSNLADSVLLHKNIQKLEFAAAYYLKNNAPVSDSVYFEMIQKHKEYDKYKYQNIEMICKYCNVGFDANSKADREKIDQIKKEINIVQLVQWYKKYGDSIHLEQLSKIENVDIKSQDIFMKYVEEDFEGVGEKRSYYALGSAMLESGIKDPSEKLSQEIFKKNVESYIDVEMK